MISNVICCQSQRGPWTFSIEQRRAARVAVLSHEAKPFDQLIMRCVENSYYRVEGEIRLNVIQYVSQCHYVISILLTLYLGLFSSMFFLASILMAFTSLVCYYKWSDAV